MVAPDFQSEGWGLSSRWEHCVFLCSCFSNRGPGSHMRPQDANKASVETMVDLLHLKGTYFSHDLLQYLISMEYSSNLNRLCEW